MLGVACVKLKPYQIRKKYFGETDRALADAFLTAAIFSPMGLLIDEADQTFPDVDDGLDTKSAGVLQQELDNAHTWRRGAFLFCTTNRLERVAEPLRSRSTKVQFPDVQTFEHLMHVMSQHLRELDPRLAGDPAKLKEVMDGFGTDMAVMAVEHSLSDLRDFTKSVDEAYAAHASMQTSGLIQKQEEGKGALHDAQVDALIAIASRSSLLLDPTCGVAEAAKANLRRKLEEAASLREARRLTEEIRMEEELPAAGRASPSVQAAEQRLQAAADGWRTEVPSGLAHRPALSSAAADPHRSTPRLHPTHAEVSLSLVPWTPPAAAPGPAVSAAAAAGPSLAAPSASVAAAATALAAPVPAAVALAAAHLALEEEQEEEKAAAPQPAPVAATSLAPIVKKGRWLKGVRLASWLRLAGQLLQLASVHE
jgi:hypothetical protein